MISKTGSNKVEKQEWSKWMKLKRENLEKIPKLPEVYEIRFPQSIPRFLGEDKEGLLLIGQSSNLRKRLSQFWKAINGKNARHSEGKTFFNLHLEKKFPKK